MSKKYEFRTEENKHLGSVYGYTPEEAAKAYFLSAHNLKPDSVTENSDGTFGVFIKGRVIKMIFKEEIN